MACPELTVDLDVPPEERWQQLVSWRAEARDLLEFYVHDIGGLASVAPFLRDYRDSCVDAEYVAEMRGVARVLDASEEEVILGNVFSVAQGYPIEILGKYGLAGPAGGPWAFTDYKETGRKVYCYWQAPLTWVTLGIWALAVPVSYPCWTQDLTQEEWVDELRTLAVAAGGNLVIASSRSAGRVGVILRASPEYLDRMKRGKAPSPTPVAAPPGVKSI